MHRWSYEYDTPLLTEADALMERLEEQEEALEESMHELLVKQRKLGETMQHLDEWATKEVAALDGGPPNDMAPPYFLRTE